jgi:hypothetical protein
MRGNLRFCLLRRELQTILTSRRVLSIIAIIRPMTKEARGGEMPSWMLRCPKCSFKFSHSSIASEILEQAHRDPFRVVPRPTMPTEGESRQCPSCKKDSVFKPFELFYIDDRARGV